MKRRVLTLATLLFITGILVLQGAYSYYFSETLSSPNWANWTAYGNSMSVYTVGSYTGAWPNYNYWGGTGYIFPNATPPSSDTEVKATVFRDISSDWTTYNGWFSIYLNTTGNPAQPVYGGFQQGPSYYQVAISSGSYGSYYTINAVYPEYSGGFYTTTTVQLGSGQVNNNNDLIAVRALRNSSTNQILLYVDDVLRAAVDAGNYPITGTKGGLAAGSQTTVRNLLLNASFGARDTISPNAITSSNITKTPATHNISLQWPAATDDVNGVGVFRYELWRDGNLLATTQNLSFNDTAGINPTTTYNYTLKVFDYHMNVASTTFSVTTPPVSTQGPYPSVDPDSRRTGVRSTGAYWGAGSENIDVRSGNLNFTLQLVTAKARNGMSVPFALSYNSQNWRWDATSASNWKFGRDVGYGWGWKLQAGSITPVYADAYTISYYLFTDSTGAEYKLDQPSGGEWTSKESTYVYWVPAQSRLYFRDGSFWYFGCVAAEGQPDQGVLYPTKMQDINGNQILVKYAQPSGVAWANSSARVDEIEDILNPTTNSYTYKFYYNGDSTPHLTSIGQTSVGTQYTFNYVNNQSLYSPFNSASAGATTFMQSVSTSADGRSHTFTTAGTGEITQIQLPFGGKLAYDYVTMAYPSGVKQREVQTRTLYKDVNGSVPKYYTFSHESSTTGDIHSFTELADPGGIGKKRWEFGQSGTGWGLVSRYQGIHLPGGPTTKVQIDYTWAMDAANKNSYISEVLTTKDPGQVSAAASKKTQVVDNWGNVTSASVYDYNSLTTPKRTDTFTYVTNSSYYYSSYYLAQHVFGAMLTGPNVSIAYDPNHTRFDSVDTSAYLLFDPSSKSNGYRGLPDSVTNHGVTTTFSYSPAGQVQGSSTLGMTSTVTLNSAYGNYSVPQSMTVSGPIDLAQTFSYNGLLQVTNAQGPNGSTTSASYNSYGIPTGGTSPFGASATLSYPPGNPATSTSTVNGRWSKTTMDGLGRPVKQEAGYGSTTVSIVETQYDSCGCSPTGKLLKTSLPYAPNGSPVWTTNTYDGIGRTLATTTVGSETQSVTTYLYEGNTVKVTDSAGKWKKYTTNVLGQLTQVTEPDATGGGQYVTTYEYDSDGHLFKVNMPRPSGTQLRQFNYDSSGLLTSATNPESGTKSYDYNTDRTLKRLTDAKGQRTEYDYDQYKRVSRVRRGGWGQVNTITVRASGSQVPGQDVTFVRSNGNILGSFTAAGRQRRTIRSLRR